jgi:hypothetical protein
MHFIDDVARILAAPVPRRKAFQLLGGAVAGTLFIGFAKGQRSNCSPACRREQKCMDCGGKYVCAWPGQECCGVELCRRGDTCLHCGSSNPVCAPRGQVCCGNTIVSRGHICCETSRGVIPAPVGSTCCGRTYCQPDQKCCRFERCCERHQTCCNDECCNGRCEHGRCTASAA